MISLSKITVSDKVSAWIQLVNNIVDTVNDIAKKIKLAVSPSSFDANGNPIGGNDGYISSLDKKKIDELDITYMPIRGELPADATWYKAKTVTNPDSFYLTVESDNVTNITFTTDETREFEIIVTRGEIDDYAIKYVNLIPNEKSEYTCKIWYKDDDKNDDPRNKYVISKRQVEIVDGEEIVLNQVVLRFIFIGKKYFVYEEGKLELPEMKTVNGEVIFGTGDIDLVAPDELKTLNGQPLVGEGDITTLQATDFKTIDGIEIVGEGDIDIVLPEELKTINGQSLVGEGDIVTLQSSDLKTINGEIIVGEGDIVTLQISDFKTINGESIVGSGDIDVVAPSELKTINGQSLIGEENIIVLQESDFKTINGVSIIGTGELIIEEGLKEADLKTINGVSLVGIGDIITLKASDFKTINGQSIIGTGDITIQGGGEDPQNKSRLGVARLGEMVLGAKTI